MPELVCRTNVARRFAIAGAAAVLSTASVGIAQTIDPFLPTTPESCGWSRGDVNSTYYEWNVFSSQFFSTANVPDAGQFPSPLPVGWPEFRAGEITGFSNLTAAGDIYALSGPGYFRFDMANYPAAEVASPVDREPISLASPAVEPGDLYTTVIVQIRTVGFEMQRGTNVIATSVDQQLPIGSGNPIEDNWPVAGELPIEDTEFYRFDRPDEAFLGDFVDTRFVYEVPGAHPQLFYLFETAQHTSVRNVVVDTFVARVPGAATPCPGDATGDAAVDGGDLLAVINNFGATGVTGPENGDIDGSGDGVVDGADLLAVINNFGVTCN